MSDLLPCPFCGEKVKIRIAPKMHTVMFICDECGADVCFYGAEFGEKAIMAWNRRAKNTNSEPVQYPCRSCVYFDECGEYTRTEPCSGRLTKRERRANSGSR